VHNRQLATIFLLSVILISSTAYSAKDYMGGEGEDGAGPVTTQYEIDIDGDKSNELVEVLYGTGVSDKALTIKVYKGNKLISTLTGRYGIQSNYKIEDMDADGKKEIVIWSGLWDFRLPGEGGVTKETYEGHSAPHRYVVVTYKLIRGQYYLWDVYTTKKKYEPFCEEQPK